MTLLEPFFPHKHRRPAAWAAALILAMSPISCGDTIQGEYCQYSAYLSYDASLTPLAPLQAALNGSNTFAFLSMPDGQAGKYYTLSAQLYGGETETVRITTASATRTLPTLGLQNSTGFVIGNSSLQDDNPYVFDRVCPNCYADTRNTRHVLQFANSSTLRCSTCSRSYSLLSGGTVSAGDSGQKLLRYRATTTSTGVYIRN